MKSVKASQLPLFTTHEDPKDAVVASHRLLIRAGYMKKQASGFYIMLPFALLVQQNIEQIIREEMAAAGCVEVKLPVLTDAEYWKTSGRWDVMGKEMMRLKDRHDNDFALGPTHEEAMTSLAGSILKSYKQLPLTLYQIGTKYRDEIRPRYGLIRCREFTMKDAYSFHENEESLDEVYQKMRIAYRNIFQRCGLQTLSVQADSGNMGGSASEEFMVPSEIGEETLLISGKEEGDYKSNQEKTEFIPAQAYSRESSKEEPQKISTPQVKSVEEVAQFLKKEVTSFIKTVIYETDESVILAFIPGDRDINEVKLKNICQGSDLAMASAEAIKAVTGAEPGFAGPYKLPVKDQDMISVENTGKKTVKIYYDRNLLGRGDLVSGANDTDYHFSGLQEGRDFIIPEEQKALDLVLAKEGDRVPGNESKTLQSTKGIEVGHIFKLGYKYSKAFNTQVLDKNGKALTAIMGTYGIGVGRTIATIVEQNYDDKGIIWPKSIAPFQIYLVGIFKNEEQQAQIEKLYQQLQDKGYSVYYDDRSENPGVKFNDADLCGFPWILIAGKNYIGSGELELKNRKTSEKTQGDLQSILKVIG